MFSNKATKPGNYTPESSTLSSGQNSSSTTSPRLGQAVMDAIKKIASQAARCFQSNTAHDTQGPRLKRRANDHTTHSMCEVRFASSPRVGKHAGFPHQVEHRFSAGGPATRGAPSIHALLPALSKSIGNKQGFVYLYDDKSASPMAKFVNDLQDMDAIDVGHGCRIVGAFQTPAETASIYSPQWTLQVHDSALEVTFEIPVTEVPLKDLRNPRQTTGQLLHMKNCMDSHLRALPDAFKDSTACPAIICPQLPRLAQLVTAQEECLGRQFRGELNCRQGIDWIYAAEATLKTISPESPRFIGEESVDFESFFNRNGIHAFADHEVPFSIGLAGENADNPNYIRAFKRHIPHVQNNEPNANVTQTRSRTTAKRESIIPETVAKQVPSQAPRRAPNQATAARVANQPLPTTVPSWLEPRSRGLAFKEPQLQMQCASQAVNCVMQRHEVGPEQVASFVLGKKLQMLETLEMNPGTQAGLMHPSIVRSILQGKAVTISRADYLGATPDEICVASELTPSESWRHLINIGAVDRNQNWVEHSRELSAIDQITITPADWLSVQRGTEMRDLLELVNNTLTSSRQAHQPHSMVHVNTATDFNEVANLEQRARQFIAGGKDFPIIVRTGGVAGHYYAIVPNQHGNWLGLNAFGTQITGVQQCDLFCRAGELAQTLQSLGVTDILVPAPQR